MLVTCCPARTTVSGAPRLGLSRWAFRIAVVEMDSQNRMRWFRCLRISIHRIEFNSLEAVAKLTFQRISRRAQKDRVGALGMCLTGGFAPALMTEPKVIAPVLAETSLPFPNTATNRAAIDASEQEITYSKRRLKDKI
jgi:dienelactone hydrolase